MTIRHSAIPLFVAGVTGSFIVAVYYCCVFRRTKRSVSDKPCHSSAYEALIGNTPLVKLEHLSKIVGRSIYVKMESHNPGGTGKDRAALGMIRAAEASGTLPDPSRRESIPLVFLEKSSDSIDQLINQVMKRSKTGGLVVEGTSGSTGIALANLCASRGHACLVVMPDDQAQEKQTILRTLGATVHVVPNAAISNPKHYVNTARRLAERARSLGIAAVFIDQFENKANFDIHYQQTGPEIWTQCKGISAFVMSSGTGGTIAGVGKYLKTKCQCQVVLVDPPGSALFHKIEHGIAYSSEQSERSLKRHRYDTLAEGIGLDRVTNNLAQGLAAIDRAIRVSDQEAIDMAYWLLRNEGLWVGSSSAMNVVGAVRCVNNIPQGGKVVTVICDAGQRHVTRFWNREFCITWGLHWPGDNERIPECLRDITVT